MSKDTIRVRMTASRPGPRGAALDVDTDQVLPVDVAQMLIANNWANAHPVESVESESVDDAVGPDEPVEPVKPPKTQARTKRAPKTKG